jgi:hypothetical protein
MQSGGLAARRDPVRAVLRAVLSALAVVALSGCGDTVALLPDPEPGVGPRPVNVNEELVAMTMDMAGLVTPYRVVGIRLGVLGDLRGVAPAERVAVAAWQGDDTTALDLAAWKVELVGTQRPAVCGTTACDARYTLVEAFVAQNRKSVIGITMRQLLPGDPLIPSDGP